MKIERALKIRSDLEMAYASAYYNAEHFCLTSNELNESLAQARKRIAPARTPGWVFSYLSGYSRALSQSLYRDSLIHGGIIDGTFYSTHSSRPDYYGKNGIEPEAWSKNATATGHYWKHNVEKPFFVSANGAI